MNVYFLTIVLGVVSSLAMSIFLVAIEKSKMVDSKDFWIFGRLFYAKQSKAKILGLSAHAIAGIIFSFVYLLFWSSFDLRPELYPVVGLITGSIHGVGVGISQIILLSNSQNGLKIGLTHALSHAVYGLVLGIGVSLVDTNSNYVAEYARIFSTRQISPF